MTVESCIAICVNGGYPYAGVEFGQVCSDIIDPTVHFFI
jgi:hypothetical protein